MMFKWIITSVILLMITGIATANEKQLIWFLGDGIQGPVLDWSGYFYQSSGICFWSSNPPPYPKLTLSLAERHLIHVSGGDPVSVFSADLDGDGDNDIMALSGYMGGIQQILWWENLDSAGLSWEEHTINSGFQGGQNVLSVDIDGNGTMDVVAANRNEQVCWWSNTDGTGTQWEEHLACEAADWVECADIDGDGDIDLALASWWFDTMLWCENVDGNGEVWQDHKVAGSVIGSICGNPCDINSDGYLDLIGLGWFNNSLYWWENLNGTGTAWADHVISDSFAHPQAMHGEDVDGDGDIDVAAVSGDEGDLVWFRNDDGFGGSWTKFEVTHVEVSGELMFDVHISDLDSDGDMDICSIVNNTGGCMFWCENLDGIGEDWAVHVFAPYINSAWSIHPSDINGDGKNDLVACMTENPKISWWDLNENGYSTEGYLESSILDTNTDYPVYNTLTWQSEVPSGTELSLQLRASDDYNVMGDWSEPLYSSPIQVGEVVEDGDRYFQYRVNMETSDQMATSWLSYISLTWNAMGLEEGDLEDVGILSVASNPISGSATVAVTCEEPLDIELTVFDISGRQVYHVPSTQYETGVSTIEIGSIPPGIYMCVMTVGDSQESLRFVLTE